jgi:hypothetical protein
MNYHSLMSDALPPALLSRLRSDAASFCEANSSSSLSDATQSGRSYSSRRLLALTPKALSTVDRVMSSQNDKDALAAASLVLAKSPATRDEISLGSDSSLSSSLVSALAASLSSFASAFAAFAPKPVDYAVSAVPSEPPLDATFTYSASRGSAEVDAVGIGFNLDTEDDPVNTEALSLDTMPPASGATQLTAHGLMPVEPLTKETPMAKGKKAKPADKAEKSQPDMMIDKMPPAMAKKMSKKGKKC